MKKQHPSIKVSVIDLPTTIPYSFVNLLSEYPESGFLLPNEISNSSDKNVDFVFYTNTQLEMIPSNSFDIAINTMSLAEMKREHILEYFDLLRGSLKTKNIFYCVNRWQNKLTKEDKELVPFRFIDWP